MIAKNTSYKRGLDGEAVAIAFLKLKGYNILETRYRTMYGEIDLIAQQDEVLVCVEVKTRQTLYDGLHAVQPVQQGRIMNAYLYFIQTYPSYASFPVRFDVMVCVPNLKPIHIQNAFEYSNEK